jgi:hypothetical protein
MGTDINENTAAIHRKSVSEAFGAKPAPEPVKKPSPLEEQAKELQNLLGSDVIVKPQTRMKKGGKIKSSASSRADGIAQRGKTKGKYL